MVLQYFFRQAQRDPRSSSSATSLFSRNTMRRGVYALAVGLLGDRIDGTGPVQAEWPTNVRTLSLHDVMKLQERLRDLGFGPGAVDGLVGPDTRAAVRRFQREAGLIPDGHVSNEILEHLG